ncbi:MAG: heavy metal translocating P-type ATPase [Haloferacaceae archaeon]
MTMSCTLCDLPTPDPPFTDDDVDGTYCCRGCLEVAKRLDDVASADATDVREALDGGDDASSAEGESTFLAVDGMHCATCEAFLESRATAHEGVHAAEASYPSNLLKLTYDADAVDEVDLRRLVDGAGYRARDLDEDPDEDAETNAVGRLVVGGFFGMMTMLWYVLFLYPVYFGMDPQYLFVDVTGNAGRYLLANIWVMTSIVLGYTGFPILRGAYVSLKAGQPNMDLLVALAATTAYVYSTVTMLTGGTEVYFDITTVVVVVVSVGTYYETKLKERAAGQLTELTENRVDEARRRTDDGDETVPLDDVAPGDRLVVKPGERVPVDGTVVEGTGAADESLVTGESVPVRKAPGDGVVGGSMLTEGALVVDVDDDAASTLDRLVTHLWDIQSSRAGVQKLADRLAAVFVPVVVSLAALAFGYQLLTGASPTAAFLTALAVLVVSCPCALGLATPLAVASGVREALDSGVVVTDDTVFETAADADVVAFDKTGTLTTGEMRVLDAVGDDEAIRRAAAVEAFSDHPVADAVTDHVDAVDSTVTAFERHPGRGVSADVAGDRVVVGRADLFEGWDRPPALRERYERAADEGRVASYVGWDGDVRAVVVAGDQPRPEWESVVSDLSAAAARIVVITGDSEAAAGRFRAHPDVDTVFAGVPPEAKAETVQRLRADGTTVMVGDGSNDAPALAAADLGISLESGTKLAADAADVVVTTDDLSTVPTVFALTAATKRRIRQNLGWAFVYNALAVPIAALGFLNPLFAAVAMATSSLLVVANSARSLLPSTDDATGIDPPGTPESTPSGTATPTTEGDP